MATIVIGYIASAAAFYFMAARTALTVEEKQTVLPTQVTLTVAEGGLGEASEQRKAA